MEYIQNTLLLFRMSDNDRTASAKILKTRFCTCARSVDYDDDNGATSTHCGGLLMDFLKFRNPVTRPNLAVENQHSARRASCDIERAVLRLTSRHRALIAHNDTPVVEFRRSFDARLLYPADETTVYANPTKLLRVARWMAARDDKARFVYAHGTSAITSLIIEPIFVFADVVCCTVPVSYTFDHDLECTRAPVGGDNTGAAAAAIASDKYNRICFLTYVPDPGRVDRLMSSIPVRYPYSVMPMFTGIHMIELHPVSLPADGPPNPHFQEHDAVMCASTALPIFGCTSTAALYKIINLSKSIYNHENPVCMVARESYGKWYAVSAPPATHIYETVYHMSVSEFGDGVSVDDDAGAYSCVTTCDNGKFKFSIVWKYRCRVYRSKHYEPAPINETRFRGSRDRVIERLTESAAAAISNIKLSSFLSTRAGAHGLIALYHKNLLRPVGYIPGAGLGNGVYEDISVPLSVKMLLFGDDKRI